MRDAISMDRLREAYGMSVYDSAGEKIGSVDEIFYDEDSREPEWLGIGTGILGLKRVVVPIEGASMTDEGLSVRYDKGLVKDSPGIDGDEIDEATERELYAHYGLASSERRSSSLLPGGDMDVDRDRQTGLGNVDERTVTRSEEELRVGKRDVEAGRIRLRKWVETEPVQASVELERERAHVHREPIDQVVGDVELGEDEIEVPLRREEPVVEKEVVAKERIGIDTDVERREEAIADEVRRERVEVEGDADADSRIGR